MQFINLDIQQALIRRDLELRITAVLDHGKYIMGPEVAELETQLAEYNGAKHCIGVSSGTDALLVAMLALGIGPGDEVITSPFTFIATGETIALLGAKPVYIDIEADTYNMDPTLIEAAITPKTKAIMPVSLYGQCADFMAINDIAKRHGLPVIEDGAQSFGATHYEKRSGNLSTIGCTSFFPSKPLGGYGDGGACFTSDDELATKMRQLRVHGQDRRYHHPVLGVNARLDTIQAAILLSKMQIFADEVGKRASVASMYSERLKKQVVTPSIRDENTSVFAQYTVLLEKGTDREAIANMLSEQGIPTAVHYPIPLNQQPAFSYLDYQPGDLPVCEDIATRVMSLPMDAYISEEDIDIVCDALIKVLGE